MLAALLAGLFAGLLSAPHCLGMCGPLASFAALPRGPSAPGSAGARALARPLRWQIGRLLAYAALGGASGAIGAQALRALAPSWAGLALSLALALALALAAARLWRRQGAEARTPLVGLGRAPRTPLVARVLARAPREPLVLGLLTALLPCGALWSGALIAAGAGSAAAGALAMLGFAASSGAALLFAGAIGARLPATLTARRVLATTLAVGALVTLLRPLPALTAPGETCHAHEAAP